MANDTPKPKTDSEQARLKKEEKARRGRRRNRQLIGLALAILIVVGAASIINSGYTVVKGLLEGREDDQDYKAMFESFVWFDVLPFESLDQTSENTLKQVVVWGILTQQPESVEYSDFGEPMISAAAVDQYAADLFGPGFRFTQHTSFRDEEYDLTYTYDPNTQMYSAPATGLMPNYLATLVEVQQEPGGIRRVVMGYVSTRVDGQYVAAPDVDHPGKYMDYMMHRVGGQYYLYAIENNNTHTSETPAASEADSQPVDAVASVPPAASSQAPAPSSRQVSSAGAGTPAEPGEENE